MSDKQKKKQLEEKVKVLDRVLTKDPKSRLFVPLAVACLDLDRPSEAEEYCRQGLKVYPDYYQAYTVLALALIRQNRNEEAQSALLKTVNNTRGNVKAIRLLSSLYEEEGDMTQAITYLKQILPYCSADDREKIEEKIYLLSEAQRDQSVSNSNAIDEALEFIEGSGESSSASVPSGFTPVSAESTLEADDEGDTLSAVSTFDDAEPAGDSSLLEVDGDDEEDSFKSQDIPEAAQSESFENINRELSEEELERREQEGLQRGEALDAEEQGEDFASAFGMDALMGDMDEPVAEEEPPSDDELDDLLADEVTDETEAQDLPDGDVESAAGSLETEVFDESESADDQTQREEASEAIDDEEELLEQEVEAEEEPEVSEDVSTDEESPLEDGLEDEPLSHEHESEKDTEEKLSQADKPDELTSKSVEDEISQYLSIPDDIWDSSLEAVAEDLDDIIDLGNEVLDVKDIKANEHAYLDYAPHEPSSSSLEPHKDAEKDEISSTIVIDGTEYLATATLAQLFMKQGFPEKALQVYEHLDSEGYREEIAKARDVIRKNEEDMQRYDLHRSLEAITSFKKKLEHYQRD
ncbi:hypothetical protein [Desulfurispira natronophila]|uniref:Tfp pilus assembly protein PilF n=1 Tax=Desulfurispira natronophila TaxID=682562 RepID=A0A7W8DFZ4_9BACT|nr:hypothetical protein [Desulfurispira natronophila]MBB5020864.1 Tfp pilus assembly protein PilF [Desulfurispira natronophila]